MKIFYIDIEKFKNKYSKEFLSQYADIEIKNDKRFYEYTIGRYLVKNVAKRFYEIENTDIITNEYGKPIFKSSKLNFSISHSKNILIACFDEYPCGIDIEYMKPRNLNKLSEHFEQSFKTLNEFYKFWTLKEASYKLNTDYNYVCYNIFEDNYFYTVVSAQKITENPIIEPFEKLL